MDRDFTDRVTRFASGSLCFYRVWSNLWLSRSSCSAFFPSSFIFFVPVTSENWLVIKDFAYRVRVQRFRIFHTRLELEESSSHRISRGRSNSETQRVFLGVDGYSGTGHLLYLRRVFRFTFGFHRPTFHYPAI